MSASPATFATTHGALAPVDTESPPDRLIEERREELINSPRLVQFLNGTLDAIAELDQNENLKIHNSMVKCVAYYDGRSDGEVRNGEWVDNPTIAGEILPRDNEYKKQIDKLNMEMCRGRINYACEPVEKHQAAMREAAQFAEWRIATNQERVETEDFLQAENQSLLLKTIAFRYSFFDKNADSREKSVELRVVQGMVDGKEIDVCRTCGVSNPELPCQNCGDTESRSLGIAPSESLEISQQEVTAGRVVTIKPDASMVQVDLNARDISSSPFIRWRLVLRRCDWEAMFPNTSIPSSDESTESRHRSESQNNPSQSDWPSSGESGGAQFEKIEGELVWLDPKVYQRYQNQHDEQLGQHNLKAGSGLNGNFPVGLCVARIGKKILDLYPSDKNKCWTRCVYGLREHAFHGSGTLALLGPQDIINEQNAAIVANMVYNSAGRDLVRSGALQGGQLPRVDQVAYVDAPDEVTDIVKWAHGKIAPSPLSSEVYAYRSEMKGSLQDAAGTSSLSTQGAADMKVLGTATGVEASRDQAVGRMIPNRKLQAGAGAEWAKQVLLIERENYTAEVFLGLADKSNQKGEVEFTERGVRTFFESNVLTDFTIKAVEGSWVPTTPAQDRANANEFGMLSAQLSKTQSGPELLSKLAPKYGIDYDVNEWGGAQRAASLRLEEYARVAGVISGADHPPTPEMVEVVLSHTAEWARVDPIMDSHPAFMDFYSDWWTSDEGHNADPLLRLVVKEVVQLHRGGGVVQAQEQAKDQILASVPSKVAGAIESDIAHEQEIDHAEESADLQDQRELAKDVIQPSISAGQASRDN